MLGLLRQTGSRPCVQPATRMQRDGKGEAFGRNDRARKAPLYREDRAELLLEVAGFPKTEEKN